MNLRRTRYGAAPGAPPKNHMKRTLPALLALALAANVQAQGYYKDGVIYCKATVANSGDKILSVYLPPTPGYTDYQGTPATVWNVGEVPAGGVADTFFSDKGPGAFQVKNDGSCAAFVYISTGLPNEFKNLWRVDGTGMPVNQRPNDYNPNLDGDTLYQHSLESIFGDLGMMQPCPLDRHGSMGLWREGYRLAVSTDVTAKVPEWRCLNWMVVHQDGSDNFRKFSTEDDINTYSTEDTCCFQYLSYLASGETQLFDLKFWAPSAEWIGGGTTTFGFVVVLQASEFRLWPHDM